MAASTGRILNISKRLFSTLATSTLWKYQPNKYKKYVQSLNPCEPLWKTDWYFLRFFVTVRKLFLLTYFYFLPVQVYIVQAVWEQLPEEKEKAKEKNEAETPV